MRNVLSAVIAAILFVAGQGHATQILEVTAHTNRGIETGTFYVDDAVYAEALLHPGLEYPVSDYHFSSWIAWDGQNQANYIGGLNFAINDFGLPVIMGTLAAYQYDWIYDDFDAYMNGGGNLVWDWRTLSSLYFAYYGQPLDETYFESFYVERYFQNDPFTRPMYSYGDYSVEARQEGETPVPEPSTLALLGGGLAALAFAARSRRRAA